MIICITPQILFPYIKRNHIFLFQNIGICETNRNFTYITQSNDKYEIICTFSMILVLVVLKQMCHDVRMNHSFVFSRPYIIPFQPSFTPIKSFR